MKTLWLDTETVGLCGPVMLIQYAIDDGPVQFIRFDDPTDLLPYAPYAALADLFHQHLMDPNCLLVAYNASFDLFKLYQAVHHRVFNFPYDSCERPVPPFACQTLDLYVPATQKSPLAPFAFSKGASRSVAAVRKIPAFAYDLVGERVEAALRPHLPASVQLVRHRKEVKGRRDLTTIVWTVDGRLSLKNLMREYGLPTMKLDEVWPLPAKGLEKPWLPYPDPAVHDPVEAQCRTVMSDPTSPFWVYAELDIHFLRVLYEKLGRPTPNHHSSCTAAVAYTRYYGFPLDRDVLLRTREAYAGKVEQAQRALAGVDLASPKQRLAALRVHDPLIASSSRKVIQIIADSDRPSAPVARAMIDFSMYSQRLNQVEKVLECRTGRAHPSLRVMGTRTRRMAGEAGLNWQGICQAKKGIGIRAAMQTVAGGDWSQLEVAIGAAVFQDKAMQEDLDTGTDQHSMNAALMQPEAIKNGWTYERIVQGVKDKDPVFIELRKRTKVISFGLQYLCAAPKVAEVLDVSLETAEAALSRYYERYAGFAAYRKHIEKETQTADTERWSRDSVARMARTIEDLAGSVLRWDFEAEVADVLWRMGGTGISTGREGQIVRVREKGAQTYDGAIRSALLGGAIAIQSAVARQRANARVQSTGAVWTKQLMALLWDQMRVPMVNVHDEIQFAPHPNYNHERAQQIIDQFTAERKPLVKSLFFDFKPTRVWADK